MKNNGEVNNKNIEKSYFDIFSDKILKILAEKNISRRVFFNRIVEFISIWGT
jgi:hypothetical protein